MFRSKSCSDLHKLRKDLEGKARQTIESNLSPKANVVNRKTTTPPSSRAQSPVAGLFSGYDNQFENQDDQKPTVAITSPTRPNSPMS